MTSVYDITLRVFASSREQKLSRHPINHNLPLAQSCLRQIIDGLHAQHRFGLYAKGVYKILRRPVLDTGLGFLFRRRSKA